MKTPAEDQTITSKSVAKLKILNRLTSKSKLTTEDVKIISKKINIIVAKRLGLL